MEQCDSLTKKRHRCQRSGLWTIPNCLGENKQGRSVHLCVQHHIKYTRLVEQNKRLLLMEGGNLGAYNKYKYGYVVTTETDIDWETVTKLHCPEFWS